MNRPVIAALLAIVFATPTLAQEAGDATAGAKEFNKCKACHMIQPPEGDAIVKGGKTGPNLYGVIGRAAGSQEDFAYSDALIALKDTSEVWTEEDLAAYITDPNAFVREKTGDEKATTKMTFKLKKGQADVAAYLASVAQ